MMGISIVSTISNCHKVLACIFLVNKVLNVYLLSVFSVHTEEQVYCWAICWLHDELCWRTAQQFPRQARLLCNPRISEGSQGWGTAGLHNKLSKFCGLALPRPPQAGLKIESAAN